MFSWIANYKKYYNSEKLWWLLIFFIVLWKFGGLLQGGLLPGWDTLPHYYGLEQMVKFLQSGSWTGYNFNWFGGFPLFNFYAPLLPAVIASVYLAFFKLIPLVIVYRVFIFASIFFFVWVFRFFCLTYFGSKTKHTSFILALAFLFYPKLLANYGLGAATAIIDGMFVNFVGLSLFLLFLSLLHRYQQNPSQSKMTQLIFLGVIVVLSHTLTTISLFIAVIFYLLFYWRWSFIKKLILIGISTLGLSAFWLWPFIHNISLSSSAVTATRHDYLFLLFPFDWVDLLAGKIWTLEWLAAMAFFAGILGFIWLLKKRQYLWPVYFLVTLFILPSQYLVNFFPNWPLHYYRFFAFLYLIFLAISAYGLAIVQEYLKQKKSWRLISYTVFILIIIYSLFHYSLAGGDGQLNIRFARFDDPYHFNIKDYPGISTAEKVADYLVDSLSTNRIFVEQPITDQADLGSPHYFKTVLPLRGKEVIDGLYIEGAIQSPLVMPTLSALSKTFTWGDSSVYLDPAFRLQERDALLRRLAYLRVDTIVARSNKLKSALSDSDLLKKVNTINEYDIYQFLEVKPMIYAVNHRPGIFFVEQNSLSYRDVVKIWYKFPALLDFPLVQANNSILTISDKEISQFGYIITSAPNLTREQLDRLTSFKLPVIWLNGPQKIDIPAELTSRIFFIDDFYNNPSAQGVIKIADHLSKLAPGLNFSESKEKEVKILTWSEKEIVFSGTGPVIINIGYFPYWQPTNSQTIVYQSTPASQILVWPANDQEQTRLVYKPNTVSYYGQIISLISVLVLVLYFIYGQWFKQRRVK